MVALILEETVNGIGDETAERDEHGSGEGAEHGVGEIAEMDIFTVATADEGLTNEEIAVTKMTSNYSLFIISKR